jgi:hypothetical protein
MSSNSIAPSGRAVDIYLDGSDWKVDLYATDLSTQVASTSIGAIAVGADSVVAVPLDLRALGGDAANELRIFGAGILMVRHVKPLLASHPVAALTVANGEVIGQQIESIEDIGAGITRISIAFGGGQ